MKRAAIYARVSTAKEEQARALDGAVARLRQAIEARGLELEQSHVYVDRAASGGTSQRAAYQAMRAAIRAGEVDVIVTTKLDRLARSLRELVEFAAELEALGVDLVAIDQAGIDTRTPTGRLLFNVLGSVAEFERDLIRDRVIRGLERAREKGKRLGRRPSRVDLDEVRSLRAKGMSLRAIARRITARVRGGLDGKVSATWLSRRLHAG